MFQSRDKKKTVKNLTLSVECKRSYDEGGQIEKNNAIISINTLEVRNFLLVLNFFVPPHECLGM